MSATSSGGSIIGRGVSGGGSGSGGSRNNGRNKVASIIDIVSVSLFCLSASWFLRTERKRRQELLLGLGGTGGGGGGGKGATSRRGSAAALHRRRSSLQQNQKNMIHRNHSSSSSFLQSSSGNHGNNKTNDGDDDVTGRGGGDDVVTAGVVGSRGYEALSPPIPYLQRFLQCLQYPCDPQQGRRDGYIPLCVAENKLVLEMLAERLMQVGTATAAFADSTVYCYNSFLGLPVARDAAAYFVAKRFLFANTDDISNINNNNNTNNSISSNLNNHHNQQQQQQLSPQVALEHIKPNHVALGSGGGSLLNYLFFILGEPDDACLIPSPYYAAFENDMSLVAGCVPVGFQMANVALGPTERDLDIGYIEARSKGLTPRFLLLTNPNNPLGVIYKPEIIKNAIEWARKRGLQTIVDEIYALSTHAKYNHGFRSVIQVLDNQLGDDVHWLWTLSKDFGASGLRVGIVYSQNETFMEALSNLNIFSGVSGPIQYVVSELLTDDIFVDHFLDESRNRIIYSYNICTSKLDEMVLPYVNAEAGIFVYVDFSSLLPEKTFEWEDKLSDLMFKYARVVLTPGKTQNERTPGMFRICYAWVLPEVLQIAMERLSKLVAKIRRMDWEDLNEKTLMGVV